MQRISIRNLDILVEYLLVGTNPRIVLISGKAGVGKTYTTFKLLERLKDLGIPAVNVNFADRLKEYTYLLTGQFKNGFKDRSFDPRRGLNKLRDLLVSDFEHLTNSYLADIKVSPDKAFNLLVDFVKANPDISYRQLMQFVGTEIFREQVHPDYWVAVAKMAIDRLFRAYSTYGKTCVFVIGDWRFKNEVEFLVKHNLVFGAYPDCGSGGSSFNIVKVRVETPADIVAKRLNRSVDEITNLWTSHISETAIDNYRNFDFVIQNF